MSATPITFNITKGAGAPLPVENSTLLIGVATSGTATAIVKISNTSELQSTFGNHGPLIECAAKYLSESGRPLYCQRINDSVAATASSVTATRVDSSTGTVATTGSSPVDSYDVLVTVLTTGSVASTDAVVSISFDGGITTYATRQIAATIAFAEFGVTLAFADSSGPVYFEAGDTFSFTTTAPGWALADLQACLDAWISSEYRVRRIHAIGVSSTSIHAGIKTRMTTAAGQYKFARFLEESDDQGGGESVATWAAAVVSDYNVDAERQAVVAGWIETLMPITGFQLRRPIAWTIGPRLASIDISEDPGAVLDGPLSGVVVSETYPIPQDGRLNTTLEGRGYTYVQSYIGRSGAYCAAGLLRVPIGDQYSRIAHGQVIDEACDQVYNSLLDLINTSVLANADGTIYESEARAIEARVNSVLKTSLVNTVPQRVSPRPDEDYAVVDRTNNIVSTENLIVTVQLTPKGFIRTITVNIGFAVSTTTTA